MIITTTDTVEGKSIEKVLGLVMANSVRAKHIGRDIMAGLRRVLSEIPGIQAKHARLLYGGSVDASNVESFLSQQDINGVLVGGASLEATSFCHIVDQASKIGG